MKIYLAMNQPEYEPATVAGVFSTLRAAQLALTQDDESCWEKPPDGRFANEWWHKSPGHLTYSDFEVRALDLDNVPS